MEFRRKGEGDLWERETERPYPSPLPGSEREVRGETSVVDTVAGFWW